MSCKIKKFGFWKKHNIFWYARAIHHNVFITLLSGSKVGTMLVKQPCYIHTKMFRLYRKMTIYGHFFYVIYTFLWSFFKLCFIQNHVIMNSVIKRFVCVLLLLTMILQSFKVQHTFTLKYFLMEEGSQFVYVNIFLVRVLEVCGLLRVWFQ